MTMCEPDGALDVTFIILYSYQSFTTNNIVIFVNIVAKSFFKNIYF